MMDGGPGQVPTHTFLVEYQKLFAATKDAFRKLRHGGEGAVCNRGTIKSVQSPKDNSSPRHHDNLELTFQQD